MSLLRPISLAVSGLFVASALTGCIPIPSKFSTKWNLLEAKRYEEAQKDHDNAELRRMCVEPFTYFKPPFVKWTEEESSKKACEALKTNYDVRLEQVKKEVAEGKLRYCLAEVHRFYEEQVRTEDQKPMPWEFAEPLQAELSPVAESCIARIEKMRADGEHGGLLLELGPYATQLSGPALTEEQGKRVAAVGADVHANAAAQYEASAAALEASPAAAALYLAAASYAAEKGGDAARAKKNADAARAAAKNSGIKSNLVVTLKGSGLAKEAIARVINNPAPKGIELGPNGDHVISVSLAAPSTSSYQKEVTETAGYEVSDGTRTNPDWTRMNKECDDDAEWLAKYERRCAEHGANNDNCELSVKKREEMNRCRKKLSGLQKEVPATKTMTVSYPATRFSGAARGTITLRIDAQKELAKDLVAKIERHRHAAVAEASLGASNASAVRDEELVDDYVRAAADAVTERASVIRGQRAAAILKAARQAKEDGEIAKNLVAYLIAIGQQPEKEVKDEYSEKLGLPVMIALEVLEK